MRSSYAPRQPGHFGHWADIRHGGMLTLQVVSGGLLRPLRQHTMRPSVVDRGLNWSVHRQRHAKRPSTQTVAAMLQAFIVQRVRSYGAVLQRLSGTSGAGVKGTPYGVDERGYAMFGAAGRRTGHEEQNTAP
jgi:hypothetical protein